MRSLRTRLLVHVTGGAALLFLAAGLALTAWIAAWLEGEFDRGLLAKARALVALTEQEDGRIELDLDSRLMPEFGAETGAEYFELRLADGTLLRRSPSFDADPGTRGASLLRSADRAPAPRFQDLRLPDGRPGRQVQIDFVPATDPEDDPATGADAPAAEPATAGVLAATVIVARERGQLDADLRRLQLASAGLAVGLMLALAGLTHLALRVGLRSLERLAGQLRALDAASLGTRVDVAAAPPAEVAVVVAQVNALLDRLETAFARERRLSSDIAHELRTPVAELRSLCEIGARWPEDRTAVRRFFEDTRGIALQMERVIEHLLALARCDEGQEPVRRTPVRVAELVDAAWKPLGPEAAARRLELRQEISPALRLETDPDKLLLIVANLLSNAVAHGSPGSVVRCTSALADGRASVCFSNRAEDLAPQDLAVMFDRFWRKDAARGGGRHAGLGLSLVRALAELLDIEVETRLDPDRTLHVTLSGPVAGPGGVRSEAAPRAGRPRPRRSAPETPPRA